MDALNDTVTRLGVEAGPLLVGGAPEGFDALLLAALGDAGGDVLVVCRDDAAMARKADALRFFAPKLACLEFPAWDCLPYDRVSPRAELVSRRIDTLTRLLEEESPATGRVVLTTVSAALQRVPPRQGFAGATTTLDKGARLDPAELAGFLERHGYQRADTVMEPGEYARRGGILDVFPAGAEAPVRLDFFGDELEGLRAFDAASQRTTGPLDRVVLKPVSEVPLDGDAVTRFRSAYRVLFGKAGDDDPLYGAVTAGHRHVGMEHWLPLFHERLETLMDYLPGARVILDHQAEEARDARLDLIAEYYAARLDFADAGPGAGLAAGAQPYHPVPPEKLYLDAAGWDALLEGRAVAQLFPFAPPDAAGTLDAGGRAGHDFADVRVRPDANVFQAVRDHIAAERAQGRKVVLAALTDGSRERLRSVLADHGVEGLRPVGTWAEALQLDGPAVALAVVALERGFQTEDLAVIAEPDILGERMSRPARRRVKPENFIAEASALNAGDLVVHVDHGIGRFH
ncbi:MAG: transcription-repair coupling factor, partial [Rhodospirillales bacterium]